MKHRDAVAVVNAPLVTGYGGQKVRDWANATRSADVEATVQPMSSLEDTGARQTTVTRWRLFTEDLTAPLVAVSRVEWDGMTLEVEGDVELWKRRGVPHHFEAVLRRVTDAQPAT